MGRRAILAGLLAAGLAPAAAPADGPPDLRTLDRHIYEATGAVAPRHPVTGRPVLNVVPETLEVRLARDFFRDYAAQARARGARVDPPGRRLARVRRVFARLVDVAHRRTLPWEVHLVDDPTPNAFTAGGGLVVVLSGLWEEVLTDGDEAALAAVLAHEIAHVTLLHPPRRVTWLGVGGTVSRNPQDPYYRAAYTHEQEAEADRLSTLYLALAGYDPLAASRLWERVAAQSEESAARARFLHDHPMSAERVSITREAGRAVSRYWKRGRRNPGSDAILEDNVLHPRVSDARYRTGDGLMNAALAALDVLRVHRRTTRERDQRRASADHQARVRVVGTWHTRMADGQPGLAVDVWNGGQRVVDGLQVSLAYWNRGAMVFIDECEHAVSIPPGTARSVTCLRQGVESDRIEPRIGAVRWR